MTPETLAAAVGCTKALADLYAAPLAETCDRYGINTPERLAAFLAQIGHESGSFRYSTELWGPTPAQSRYEGRKDLGNTQPGDGSKFRGHGLIQTTGRYNHAKTRDALAEFGCPDFEAEPERLAEPRWAALSAGWYWQSHGCNELADAGNFEAITRKINGGLNGQDDRVRRWEKAKAVLMFAPADPAQEKTTMPLPLIVGALLPSLIEAIPKLSALFGSGSDVQERNVAAATTVMQIVQDATGARNAQEAVEMIQSDPQALQAATKAVQDGWFTLTESGGGGITGAREADAAFAASGRKSIESPAFILSLVLLAMPFMLLVDVFYVHPDSYSGELRTQIITGVLMVISMVSGFWLGSSFGSMKKTEAAEK